LFQLQAGSQEWLPIARNLQFHFKYAAPGMPEGCWQPSRDNMFQLQGGSHSWLQIIARKLQFHFKYAAPGMPEGCWQPSKHVSTSRWQPRIMAANNCQKLTITF
jgi:hypothetical protein